VGRQLLSKLLQELSMNQNWTAGLQEQLAKQKAELTERVDKIRADIGRGLEADSKEQATQLENQEVLDALANEATVEINKINAALQRMGDGSYGTCLSCGEAIDRRRLNVRPYASRCIACASND
jgi:DnaK suppressor protein